MKTSTNVAYIKRTQKDYSLSLKLQIVREVEQGHLTKAQAKVTYGIQGDSTVTKWKSMVILIGRINPLLQCLKHQNKEY